MQTISNNPKNWIKIILFVLSGLILLAGVFYAGIKYSESKQTRLSPSPTPKTKELPFTPGSTVKEISEWYSVEYPADFFIAEKDDKTFSVAEKRWKGIVGNIPTAGILVYTNVIPEEMSLREWLNGVGDPNPPIGESSPKSCREFFDGLRQKIKYGDLYDDPYFKEGNCMYLGVSDIQDASVAGLKGIKFNTQFVSAGATHTVVIYKNKAGVMILFDIFMRLTGMSDENDRTIEAYSSFLSTFNIREE